MADRVLKELGKSKAKEAIKVCATEMCVSSVFELIAAFFMIAHMILT